jgi:WD40 repeat protein
VWAVSKNKQKVRSSDDIRVGRSSGGSVTSIAGLQGLDLIATGEHDGKIELWDVSGMRPRNLVIVDGKSSPHGTAHHSTVSSLLWIKTGSLLDRADYSTQGPKAANIMLSGDFRGVICAWRLEADSSSGSRASNAQLHSALSAIRDPSEISQGRAPPTSLSLHKLPVEHGHEGAVIALVEMRFRGRQVFASGSEDRSVKFWDVSTQSPQLSDTLQLAAGVCALAWLPHARSEASTSEWLAIGMGVSKHLPNPNCIQIWDTEQKCKMKELLGHDKPLRSLVWLEDRGWLASASVNGVIRLWRVRGGQSNQDKAAARGTQSSLVRHKSTAADLSAVIRRPARGDRVQLRPEFDPGAGGCLVGGQVGTVLQDDASSVPFQVGPRGPCRHSTAPRSALLCATNPDAYSSVSRNDSTGLIFSITA